MYTIDPTGRSKRIRREEKASEMETLGGGGGGIKCPGAQSLVLFPIPFVLTPSPLFIKFPNQRS